MDINLDAMYNTLVKLLHFVKLSPTTIPSLTMSTTAKNTTPYREIRASYTPETITVYQAYSPAIAIPAVQKQSLTASPSFSLTRMTWIKPSWSWMMYRSGYSYKDARQTHILALEMKHADFIGLLRHAVLSHGRQANVEPIKKDGSVRVQWDPERSVRLDKLLYRSIQIGIPGTLVEEWSEKIVRIEDLTEKARELKRVLDEEPSVEVQELVERGLVPVEQVFDVPEDVRKILKMDLEDSE